VKDFLRKNKNVWKNGLPFRPQKAAFSKTICSGFLRDFFPIPETKSRSDPKKTRRRPESDPDQSPQKKLKKKLLSERHKSIDFEKIFHSL